MKPPRNTFKQESYRDLHKIDPPCRTCATISLANDFQITTYTLRYVMWSRNNNNNLELPLASLLAGSWRLPEVDVRDGSFLRKSWRKKSCK